MVFNRKTYYSVHYISSLFPDNSLFPITKWHEDSKLYLIIKGSCLNKKRATYTPNIRIFSFFTVYELDTWSQDLNSDFTLKDYLFGGVKLAKDTDPDTFLYSSSDIRFASRS